MVKKAVFLVAAATSLMGAQAAMAGDVRPSAIDFHAAPAVQPAASFQSVAAPARARVAKRHDLFGLSGLPLLAVVGGIGLTVGLVAVAAGGSSSPS